MFRLRHIVDPFTRERTLVLFAFVLVSLNLFSVRFSPVLADGYFPVPEPFAVADGAVYVAETVPPMPAELPRLLHETVFAKVSASNPTFTFKLLPSLKQINPVPILQNTIHLEGTSNPIPLYCIFQVLRC